eukprot:TRINITY_DN35785_c3_g1_i1.p1 TRINITY_DN35785_c3_g1~~TRINITY_DN35785_c3_g1_i1.p1  ORF type:complete len:354 (-),score=42.24 TRINITY_DN35785_c3_g1_i1:205-1266(-)
MKLGRCWAPTVGRVVLVSLCLLRSVSADKGDGTETCSAGSPGGCGSSGDYVVPPVIIGCWQLLERDSNREHAVQTLVRYAEKGFDTFDTADIYGPSEGILGQFRSRVADDLGKLKFNTKYVTDDNTPAAADRTNEASRRALGVDALDLVQYHSWSLDAQGRDKRFLGAAKEVMRLKSEGKIKTVAACNFDTTNLRVMVDAGIDIKANQVQYSLLDRRPEVQLLPYCKETGIKLLVFGVVGGGLLSDSFLGLTMEQARPKLDSISRRMYYSSLQAWTKGDWSLFQRLLRTLRSVADRHNGITILVRDDRHLAEHTKLLRQEDRLTEEDMAEIQAVLDAGKPPTGDIWDRERGWA